MTATKKSTLLLRMRVRRRPSRRQRRASTRRTRRVRHVQQQRRQLTKLQGGASGGASGAAAAAGKRFRFHVLAVPHTITRKDYSACAFTQNVLKFCKMMTARGHTVFHYGHKDSTVECSEHVPVTDNELLQRVYGIYNWKKEMFKHNTGDECNKVFNERAITEVAKRKQPGDFLLLFWGLGHEPIAKAHPDLLAVEPAIGCFNRPCTPYSVYSSYSVMNYVYGKEKLEPRWSDAVIPHYFDVADFTFNEKPVGGYFVYLGRLIKPKGLEVAIQVAKAAGKKLKMAGQGDLAEQLGYTPSSEEVEVLGYLEPEARNALLRDADALLVPSQYNEPFGCVTVEALLCGTPILTTDWGAFAETNLHGVTGYRCRSLEQWIWAAKEVGKLDRRACRKWGEDTYSLEATAPRYEEYFAMIARRAWDAENPGRSELDWLSRTYPCSK